MPDNNMSVVIQIVPTLERHGRHSHAGAWERCENKKIVENKHWKKGIRCLCQLHLRRFTR